MPSETDLFWLAGILEGEGSFMTSTSWVKGKPYKYPKIIVNMTDRDIIERVAGLLGNSVYDIPKSRTQPDRKPAYRAQITGSPAAELMTLLLPIMGVRRSAKIHEILNEYSLRPDANDLRRSWSTEASSSRTRNERGQYLRNP